MKFRKGFVTNSSSSSFVLAFKDEEDFHEFENWCGYLLYDEMKDLLMRFMKDEKRSLEEQKKDAIEFVEFAMTIDDLRDWLNKRTDEKVDYMQKIEIQKQLEQTQEYKEFKEQLLAKEEIQEKIRKIENAEKLCQGMIWDSCGGILEWAIRNGFLESELAQWTVYVQNVG